MRLIIAGKNSIAVGVLEYAMKNIDISIFVVLNSTEDFKNGFQKSLGFYANLWKIPIINLEEVYNYQDAIFLSLEFDKIIKPSLFKTKNLFNIHFSLLPAYKGMYTSALPLINAESETGVTLHKIDAGIDTGDIISQKKIKISEKDTARKLYLKYIHEGIRLVVENLSSLINNDYKSLPQGSLNSSYYGKNTIDYANLKINYKQTAFQVVNQLNAFSFREYQLPKFNDVEIGCSEITSEKSFLKPGSIVKDNKNSFKIATIDFDVILYKDLFKLLWSYCKINDYSSLNYLLEANNLDLEIKTKEGWTALIIAVYNGSFECVLQLIDAGADVNAHNYNFTSVLMYAKTNALKSNERRIIDKLIDSGSNIFSKDIFGKTVLDWVKEEDNELHNYFKSKL